MIRFNEFINSMEDFFPETRDTIDIALSESMGEMDTIVIEDIIMPKVISLLRKNEDKEKLTSLFGYFEDVVEQMIICRIYLLLQFLKYLEILKRI